MRCISFTCLLLSLLLAPAISQATDFSKLYKRVSPSVVLIKTSQHIAQMTPQGVKHSKQGGLGSGVLLDQHLILTAAHVVHIADNIQVQTSDGQIYAAKVVASQPMADLAIISLLEAPGNLSPAKVGNSDKIDIGAEVIVIGAPYGLSQTLTVGHFSGRRQHDDAKDFLHTEFLQTDAPINRGNSGGPMFNTKGEVIGIVSHIRSSSGGSEGLGFAASINMAKRLFLESPLLWSGIEFIPMSDTLAEAINAPYPEGLLVQQVAYGSSADDFGLQAGRIPARLDGVEILLGGDVIIGLGGEPFSFTKGGHRKAVQYYESIEEGGRLEMTVLRMGKEVMLSASKPLLDKTHKGQYRER